LLKKNVRKSLIDSENENLSERFEDSEEENKNVIRKSKIAKVVTEKVKPEKVRKQKIEDECDSDASVKKEVFSRNTKKLSKKAAEAKKGSNLEFLN